MSDEFDKILANHSSDNYKAGVRVLESVLSEIKEYDYVTVEQIVGAINTRIDVMHNLHGEMTSEQYQADANADHVTSEQFNGKV